MHVAAEMRVEELQVLIVAGADLNTQDWLSGETPLYSAARRGQAEVVRALIEAGAKVGRHPCAELIVATTLRWRSCR